MSQVKTKPFLLMLTLFCVITGMMLWPAIGLGQDSPDAPLSATTLDDAARVQRQGRIFVGVSPDDPPFAYPNDDFAIDGFDIAVMKAVAEKMGAEVEFSAIVFPSLLDAVQLGQVDAVISAMAITDGRLEEVDFTNPYFIGTEAFLVAAPAGGAAPTLKVDGADDLVGRKVGVQAGTIYAGWVRENLIDTGLAKEENIAVFNTIDQAIRALSKGDVDVLILDSLDANN
ncbi:MAG: amino acid ABC transporter substrate-binding protein [Anaerolineales bacterium]|nr:amino acid ABC transporter substrate-binding protein [Anaerolineales bacterium]